MLQQTTVAAVIPYFERFMDRFPSLMELAQATEVDVLRHWEGLGYYSRGRNIHKAAQLLINECSGQFPSTVDGLLRLPGIGRYTAGAIASFAFNTRAPIVEANTLRLYCRLIAYRGDPRSSAGQQVLWDFAERILPLRNAGDFNQAVMELGATVCTPTAPACARCPVESFCAARAGNLQNEVPRPVVRTPMTSVTEVAVVVQEGARFLLRQRTPGERWAGLWDFLRFPMELAGPPAGPVKTQRTRRPLAGQRSLLSDWTANDLRQIQDQVRATTGLEVDVGPLVSTIRHTVTRFRITLLCCTARKVGGTLSSSATGMRWVDLPELAEYPLSMTGRKLAGILSGLSRAP